MTPRWGRSWRISAFLHVWVSMEDVWMVLTYQFDVGVHPALTHSQYTCDLRGCKAVIQQLQYVLVGLSIVLH